MLTNKPHNIFPYFPSSEPVNNLDRIPSPGRQSIPALGNHVGERRIVCDVSWREVFRLVVNPRMRGGDGRRDDAQMRMVWGRVRVEEERCAALCGEVPNMDVNCVMICPFSVRHERRGKGGQLTVGGFRVSLIEQRKSVTTRIVGYRCARSDDGHSRVKY